MSEKEQLNAIVELGRGMERLLDNNDFKEIFIERFLKSDLEAITANLSKRKPEDRNQLVEQLVARANFREYVNHVIGSAQQAVQMLADIELEEKENING